MSPPSRAAWIEINDGEENRKATDCRRLHGRRGLKFERQNGETVAAGVAAFTGGVD